MANRDLVVIGASAGGLEALQQICRGLPADLAAAVLVVLHTSPQSGGMLSGVLSRAGKLQAVYPKDGERVRKGKVYVAPADHHMVLEGDEFRIIKGPRENRHRPAIDPTFRSAARSYGTRAIGVILTGSLDDGTSGLMVICAQGGEAIVQDPETAMFPSMPNNALKRVPDARIARLEDIPQVITDLVAEELPETPERQRLQQASSRIQAERSEYRMPEVENEVRSGDPSPYACPECGGVLWEVDQNGFMRFRCRVGHAYTALNLRAEQRHVVETALWAALRALEESASLYRRMADRTSGRDSVADMFTERASNAEANARTLRDFLVHIGAPEPELDEAVGRV